MSFFRIRYDRIVRLNLNPRKEFALPEFRILLHVTGRSWTGTKESRPARGCAGRLFEPSTINPSAQGLVMVNVYEPLPL
jgi:hypothetical protein